MHGVDWDPALVGEPLSNQVLFVGVYDGSVGLHNPFCMTLMVFDLCRHGGSAVSQYLRQELHGLLESVDKTSIPELFRWIKELGGYFKRFKGGVLAPWMEEGSSEEMDLEARATLAFFEVFSLPHFIETYTETTSRWTEVSPQLIRLLNCAVLRLLSSFYNPSMLHYCRSFHPRKSHSPLLIAGELAWLL